ncbi:hypothetical protein [Nitrosopumilus sp.]|uniref:hypothetical protein n=1 Tax=Nitrosopumilus sp. TaxID=2024843 RepID=UPI003D113B1B
MKTRNKIIIIVVTAVILLLIVNTIIPAYLYAQSDKLGFILYNCAFGMHRYGSLMLITYDNGTHTINENSCAWIKNSDHKPASMEYQEINGMSCDELIERHATNRPYQNKENKIFAESKISNCNFVDDWSDTQKKVDEWR